MQDATTAASKDCACRVGAFVPEELQEADGGLRGLCVLTYSGVSARQTEREAVVQTEARDGRGS